MNPDIELLLRSLQQQHRSVLQRVTEVEDPVLARALLREAQEILHRMNIAQNLLLAAAVKSLAAEMQEVAAADAQLTQDLKSVSNVRDAVAAVTRYLGAVDTLLDLAKAVLAV